MLGLLLDLSVVRLISSRWIDRGYLTTLIKIGLVILTFTYGLFFWIHCIFIFPSRLYSRDRPRFIGPGYQTMVVNMAPHCKRGTASSTYLSAWDLGIGIGILLGAQSLRISNIAVFSY